MTKKDFKNNFINCLSENKIDLKNALTFTLYPIEEKNKKNNSVDDVVRLWAFRDLSFEDKLYNFEQVVDLLSFMGPRFYPLWVHIYKSDISLKIEFSMRFRKPSQLKYIKDRNPPFYYIENNSS